MSPYGVLDVPGPYTSAGADAASALVLATHARPSFVDREWRTVSGEWSKSLIRSTPLRYSHPLLTVSSPSPSFFVKGRQNADRRVVQPPHRRMRLASSGTRSPVGVPPRLLPRRPNATAQPQAALPGTWLKDGCYPSPPVPVQRASRRPVIMPAGRLPRAARERGYEPRPRVPLSLRFREYPREGVP
jgi:hypothetical protein